jgi:8-oxo-dGTP diphosphatase
VPGSFGIIFDNNKNKVLLVKRRDMPVWVLPGGHAEADETPEQTVLREVKEETGFSVVVLEKVGEYLYPNRKDLNYVFICQITSGIATVSGESKAIKYFALDKLPDLISPYAPKMIDDALSDSPRPTRYQFGQIPLKNRLKALKHPWAFFKYLLVRMGIHWNS